MRKKDNDIDKYEQKEAAEEVRKKEDAKIESILDNLDVSSICDFDLEDTQDIGEVIDDFGALIAACQMKIVKRLLSGKKISAEDDYKTIIKTFDTI